MNSAAHRLSKAGAVILLAVACLQAESAGWTLADPAYRLSLPRDHAAHPDYQIEWWYYTGNLTARDGRRFGYQLTFFRVGVDREPRNPSRWAVRDLYMAHLAITDVGRGEHRFAERLNRAGPGWAGARTDAYHVWNDGWSVTLDAQGRHVLKASATVETADSGQPARSDRQARHLGLDLVLDEGKPWVAQGIDGYSRKGSERGNASHYYSLTRMPTRGQLTLDGVVVQVEGASWMDHEFGSSFLEAGQVGWDWFSIQLDNGTDLMLYGLRRQDGTRDPYALGTIVDDSGGVTRLRAGDFTLEPLERWRSPASGASYPIAWRLSVPSRGLVLEVRAAVAAQELRTERSARVTYWEGAVDVRGTGSGRSLTGRGYLEMTGYSGRAMSEALSPLGRRSR